MLIHCLDDEPRVELLLQRILDAQGHELRFDSSVKDFKAAVAGTTPDLILLDLGLGQESGIDVIHWLAEHDLVLPLVLLSGRGDSLLDTARRVAEGHGVAVRGVVNKGRLARDLPALLDELSAADPSNDIKPAPAHEDEAPPPLPNARRSYLKPESLQLAISQGAILPFLQPIVSIADGTLSGAEVLARLRLPNGRILDAGYFIPVAEAHNLLSPVTESLLDRLLEKRSQLAEVALDFLAVNLSAPCLEDGRGVELVRSLVTGLEGICTVRTEITESVATQATQRIQATAAHIKLAGASLAIDDFGTGYSSLRALAELPFETLKIDTSFVNEMFDSQKTLNLLRAIIKFGHGLGLQLVAEGIETEAQRELLIAEGVDFGQGFLFGAPMPIDEFIKRFPQRQLGDPVNALAYAL
nr:EAL domain-containing protein [Halochromatium glycolicum]